MADPPPEPLESSETLPASDAEAGREKTAPAPAETDGARALPVETDETLPAPEARGKTTPFERPPLTDDRAPPAAGLPAPAGMRVGQTLAERYTLLEHLGRGGMSEVYVARHELLKKTVAVKVLRPEIAVTKASLNRFHQEAMAAATIGSPHIIDITDYGFTQDGNAFIVMERLVGADLRTVLSHCGGPLPPGRAVGIIRQVLRGLAAAHARGIVHRDLKAENVFLCEREEGGEFVKVLDFGISKVTQPLDDSAEMGIVRTSTGAVMGTPQYIAPEQAHGDRDIDHRVDIYSAGVMLYEMLTGELPFTGRSALDVVMKHVQEEPQPPRERRPELDIPTELDAVVLKAMRKDREQRFSDAQAMLDALPAPIALPGGFESATVPAQPRPKRGYWGYGLALAAVFALGTAGVLLLFPGEEAAAPGGATPVIGLDASQAAPDAGTGLAAQKQDAARQDSAADGAVQRAMVKLQVVAHPGSARIFRGSELVGRGRWSTSVARGSAPVVLTVAAEGYHTERVTLEPDKHPYQEVRLARGKPAAVPPPKGKGPTDLHDNPYVKLKGPASGKQQP